MRVSKHFKVILEMQKKVRRSSPGIQVRLGGPVVAGGGGGGVGVGRLGPVDVNQGGVWGCEQKLKLL